MARIPDTINGVVVHFADGVNRDVDRSLVEGLKLCIKPDIASGYTLRTIHVSSASDSHEWPSRHAQHKAVDISRINGLKMVIGYPGQPFMKAIVDAIQEAFESYPHRRENFGPHFKKKLGQPWHVSGHDDHIHLSVN